MSNASAQCLVSIMATLFAFSSSAHASGGGGGGGGDVGIPNTNTKPAAVVDAKAKPKKVKVVNTAGGENWAIGLSILMTGNPLGPLAHDEEKRRNKKGNPALNDWIAANTSSQEGMPKSVIPDLTPIIILGPGASYEESAGKKKRRIDAAVERAKTDTKFREEIEEMATTTDNAEYQAVWSAYQSQIESKSDQEQTKKETKKKAEQVEKAKNSAKANSKFNDVLRK